jgi:hypothetical protein
LRVEYENRLSAREKAAAAHERQFRALGNWRLAIAAAGAALAWWNFWLLPLPVAAFIALIAVHERVDRRFTFEKRAIAYYRRALDRLDNRWPGTGESGDRFRDPDHPYADDLDVFGNGSLFQLLCTARTIEGEATLARWLSRPADRGAVLERQQAVDDLRPRLDLREDLALIGEDIRSSLHAAPLARWGDEPPVRIGRFERASAFALAVLAGITALGALFQMLPLWPLLAVILMEMNYSLWVRARVQSILHAADLPARDLRVLAQVLERLERETVSAPRLVTLKRELETDGVPASRQIARLRALVDWTDQAHNRFFAPIAGLLMWKPQFAFAIERWRLASGPLIGRWIAAVGEIEALGSLAAYAAERPDDPFPELLEHGPVFDGTGITHPLLHPALAVCNDVRLDSNMQLLLVSGSNMSGKSTLLRSVGLNAVLAWAGAPIRARDLRISRLQVGASMRIQDSVLDGKSRFYGEITRLRKLVDLTSGSPSLLFLLDELLSGTNSHDRLIGAEAIVRSFVARGAIGLVTTHDLALAHIAEELAPRAANVHFADHIENGRIAFDYRMRPGVVQKSNAIELMRSVGLDV